MATETLGTNTEIFWYQVGVTGSWDNRIGELPRAVVWCYALVGTEKAYGATSAMGSGGA